MIELINRQLACSQNTENSTILIPHGFIIRTKTWSHNHIRELLTELSIGGHPAGWSETMYIYLFRHGGVYIDIYNNKRVFFENLPKKGRFKLYCIP